MSAKAERASSRKYSAARRLRIAACGSMTPTTVPIPALASHGDPLAHRFVDSAGHANTSHTANAIVIARPLRSHPAAHPSPPIIRWIP